MELLEILGSLNFKKISYLESISEDIQQGEHHFQGVGLVSVYVHLCVYVCVHLGMCVCACYLESISEDIQQGEYHFQGVGLVSVHVHLCVCVCVHLGMCVCLCVCVCVPWEVYVCVFPGKLFSRSRLTAKTKVQLQCLLDFLFADDAAVTAHSAEDLQQLMTRFSDACQDFRLTIRLKKTLVMGQDTGSAPTISINDHELDVIHDFVYLGSAISDTLSLDAELNRHIGKAATTMTRLTTKVWNNSKLTVHTKIQIYRACVVSTLLYGNESWAMLFTCAASDAF